MELYKSVANLPLICPHGHVDPKLFSDENASLGTPADLLIIPDHYVFRMLYSQGIRLEDLGVPGVDGGAVEKDHRKIWQIFADRYILKQQHTATLDEKNFPGRKSLPETKSLKHET
jgi:glucuronate isomerase